MEKASAGLEGLGQQVNDLHIDRGHGSEASRPSESFQGDIVSSYLSDDLAPGEKLVSLACSVGRGVEDAEFAEYLDQHDPLRHLRAEFIFPRKKHLATGHRESCLVVLYICNIIVMEFITALFQAMNVHSTGA